MKEDRQKRSQEDDRTAELWKVETLMAPSEAREMSEPRRGPYVAPRRRTRRSLGKEKYMNALKKEHVQLLKRVAKTKKPWYRPPVLWLLYLIPVVFVVKNVWFWHHFMGKRGFCLAIRSNGTVSPLDVDMDRIVVGVILLFGVGLTFMAGMAISLWNDRCRFREVLEDRGIEIAQPSPPCDVATRAAQAN